MELNDNYKSKVPENYSVEDLSLSDTEIHRFIHDKVFPNSPHQSIKNLMEDIETCDSKLMREQSERILLNLLSTEQNPLVSEKQKCIQHSDEDLLFVCYNCNMKSLCIECIANGGQHNGHEIKNTRKAKPDVQILLNQNLLKLKRKIENIAEQNDKIITKKTELIETNQKLKKSLHFQFQEIHEMLNQKEKEIEASISAIISKRSKYLQELSIRIKRKINIYIESHKVIEQSIKKLSDHNICQYYYQKQKNLQELVNDSFDYGQVDKVLKDITQFKQDLQTDNLKKIIQNFNTFKEEISSFTGLETIQTQYIETEKSFFNNTNIKSPDISRITIKETPRNSQLISYQNDNNQKSDKINDETLLSRYTAQTNRNNLKPPSSDFILAGLFNNNKIQLENLNQREEMKQSVIISRFVAQPSEQQQPTKEKETPPYMKRAKSVSIFQIDSKNSLCKDSMMYSQSGYQEISQPSIIRYQSIYDKKDGAPLTSARSRIVLQDKNENYDNTTPKKSQELSFFSQYKKDYKIKQTFL